MILGVGEHISVLRVKGRGEQESVARLLYLLKGSVERRINLDLLTDISIDVVRIMHAIIAVVRVENAEGIGAELSIKCRDSLIFGGGSHVRHTELVN